jgi:hypothetical protein
VLWETNQDGGAEDGHEDRGERATLVYQRDEFDTPLALGFYILLEPP